MKIKINVAKGKKNTFYFNIVARNGQIIATSEIYTSKSKARKSASNLIRNLRFKSVGIVGVDGTVLEVYRGLSS